METTEGFLDVVVLDRKMACSGMTLAATEYERIFGCGGGMQWCGDLSSVLRVITTQAKTPFCNFSFSSLSSI